MKKGKFKILGKCNFKALEVLLSNTFIAHAQITQRRKDCIYKWVQVIWSMTNHIQEWIMHFSKVERNCDYLLYQRGTRMYLLKGYKTSIEHNTKKKGLPKFYIKNQANAPRRWLFRCRQITKDHMYPMPPIPGIKYMCILPFIWIYYHFKEWLFFMISTIIW